LKKEKNEEEKWKRKTTNGEFGNSLATWLVSLGRETLE